MQWKATNLNPWRREERTQAHHYCAYIIRNALENTVASKQHKATRLLAVLSVPPVAVITVRVTQRAAAPPSSNALIREQSHGKWSNDRGDRQPPWGCQASAGSAIAPRIHTCTNHHNLEGGRGKGSLFCWRLQIQYFCYTYAGITVILKLMEDDKAGYNRGATRWRLPVQLYYFENAGIVIFLKLVGGDTHNHYPQGHRITTAGKMVLFYASRNRNDFEVVGDERWTDWQTKVWIKEIIYMRIDSRRLDECRNKIDFFGIYRYT